MEIFAQRLKDLRSSKRIYQREMADYLGLTLRGYQCYESGSNYPDVRGLIKLADYFDVSLDYLVGRSEIKERQ